jgi:hypothetical protein
MTENAQPTGRAGRRATTNKALMYLMIAVATLLVLGANAHLLFAALESQPDCVAHLKVGHEQDGAFRAAASAC